MEIATISQFLVDLDGAALWVKRRDAANRTRLIDVYHEGEFGVYPAQVGSGVPRLYGRFEVQHQSGSGTYGPDDVVYFRTPSPYDRYATLSPTDAVLGMLGIAGELRKRVLALIRNAAVPGGFFVRPEDAERLGDPEFERAKAELQMAYNGANSGRVGLLEGGLTFVKTSLTLDQIKFGEVWREIESAACAAFGVRPEILGFMVGLENAPWSHMSTARRLAYEDSATPVWNHWSRTLTRQLLTPEERRDGLRVLFDTSRIPALQADAVVGSTIAQQMGDDLSVNERRMLIGKEPTDNPEHDEVKGRQSTAPSFPRPDPEGNEPKGRIQRKQAHSEEQKAAIWKKFDTFALEEEARWDPEIRQLLADDLAWALDLLEEGTKGWYRLQEKDDLEARIRAIMARITRRYALRRIPAWQVVAESMARSTATRAVERLVETLGISFDLTIPSVDAYARRHAAELVAQVGETTKDRIRTALSLGLREGESIPQIANRIKESGAFTPARATLIARTESTTVTNGSQVESLIAYARETGETVTKTWLATQDERTRDAHAEMDGVKVKIDEDFATPDIGLTPGPAAPNCRCTLIYAVAREGDQ